MKVLVVSSMYVREDKISAHFVHRQVVELRALGVDARVVCPIPRLTAGAPLPARIRAITHEPRTVVLDGVEVTYLPYWNAPHGIAAGLDAASLGRTLLAFARAARPRFRFRLIHAFRLFPTGYAVLRVGRALGTPVIVGARGSDVHTHPQRNEAIARRTRATIRAAPIVLAVSEGLARRIDALATPRVPVRVVYNGVDTERFRPVADPRAVRRRLGLPEQGTGIVFVGRLVPEKGLRELMRAFDAIAGEDHGCWPALVGDGPMRGELEAWRAGAPERRVFLPGAQLHDRVADWLNAADLFALPSYDEGLPNGVLEAMACARPVVATDVGGIAEAVVDGETGLLVEARAVPPLTAALRRLVADEPMRRRLGDAGLERVRHRFLWSRSARSLLRVYRDVARARR